MCRAPSRSLVRAFSSSAGTKSPRSNAKQWILWRFQPVVAAKDFRMLCEKQINYGKFAPQRHHRSPVALVQSPYGSLKDGASAVNRRSHFAAADDQLWQTVARPYRSTSSHPAARYSAGAPDAVRFERPVSRHLADDQKGLVFRKSARDPGRGAGLGHACLGNCGSRRRAGKVQRLAMRADVRLAEVWSWASPLTLTHGEKPRRPIMPSTAT